MGRGEMRFWRYLIALMALCGGSLSSRAASSVVSDSQVSLAQFNNFAKTFWDAETQLQQRDTSFSLHKPIYRSPLSKDDPLYQKYFSASNMAGAYIETIDPAKRHSWTL